VPQWVGPAAKVYVFELESVTELIVAMVANGESYSTVTTMRFPVALAPDDYALLQEFRRAELYGDDQGAALRDIVFSWWEERFMHGPR